MNLTEILKAQGLTDEQISKIMAAMKENKIYTTNEENIDVRYEKLKTERDNLKEKLTTADTTIEDLKKANKDNESLQATIKTHEGTIETMKADYAAKIKTMTMQSAIRGKLTDAKYPDLIESKFDLGKITLSDDGTEVFGVDEQLNTIKEKYADLFTPSVEGREPNRQGESGKPVTKNPWSKEHFNLTEQGRLLRENPELAAQYKASAK